MRFESLTLDRYGAFESRAMRFGPGLTVVYGANEAGKSTSLSAVGDFLFGVPLRSARGAVFGNDALRVGATLTRADGTQLSLRRRKGNAKTLLDADSAAVDEGVLAALLGSTTRERFDTLFGLNHEELRKGGEKLIKADGEIGRLIVEAGGGLASLIARLDATDQTLDKLFAARRSGDRAYYKALDSYEAADKDVRAGLLTRERYEEARAEHAKAQAEVARLRDERRGLGIETSALERMAHVIPLLGECDRIGAAIGGFADLPDLPDAFDDAVKTTEAARRDAGRKLAEAEAGLANLDARLSAIVVDPRLIAAEAQIRDAERRGVIVHNARRDRPNRVKELTQAETQIDGLRRLVGAAPGEDLGPRLPAPEAVEAVRRLAAAARDRRSAHAAAAGRIAALELQQRRIAVRIADAEGRGVHRPSGVAAAEFSSLAAETRAAAAKRREAEAAGREVEAGARALGFADVGAARGLRLPDADAIAQAVRREAALSDARLRQIEAMAAAEALRDAALADIDRLHAGGAIATDAALGEARAARDAAWAPVRAAHRDGRADPDPGIRADQTDALDRTLSAADEIADRRSGEAHRVVALAQAERQRDTAHATLAAAAKGQEEVEKIALADHAALAAAFPDAIARAPAATALKALAEERRTLLGGADAAAASLATADAAERALEAPRAALVFAERACGLSGEADVGDRVRAASAAAARHDAAHADHGRDLRARDEATSDLDKARGDLAALDREEAAWLEAWAPALARLGLGSATSPEDAGAAANEWAGARGVLAVIQQSRQRLDGMDRDEADLARRVAEIGRAVDLVLPEDAVAASEMLMERFKTNDEARRACDHLAPDAGDAKRLVERLAAERDACDATLAGLASSAGLGGADIAGLSDIAGRHAARMALGAELARAEASVSHAGDGRSPEALRAVAADRDLDAIRADLEAAEARAGELDDAVHDAIGVEHAARGALDAYEAAAGVNRAVVLRESATAELHETVERYVELSLARDLVEAAIARVRAEQQDPLVTRAGALFARATRGEFSGVAADVDDSGEPVVVGVRASGGTANTKAMSDGTRDQLFLAFRLASLEAYCAAAEPLPFVADDVLVHFDDARSRATLELLADFGSVTQVLLFTHHLSVRRMAEDLGDARCGIVELG